MKYITTIGDRKFQIEILGQRRVIVDGVMLDVDFQSVSGQPVYSLIVDGKSFEAYIYPGDDEWQVLLKGDLYGASVEDERESRLRAASGSRVSDRGEFHLKAPMPGLVVDVPISEGQQVEQGAVLIILESMKMQNELRSPKAGTVSRVRVEAGDSVEQKQTLLSVE
ncbi:MAG: acetyl-CoA carboxylase biotin carboxyl carrier protein subunit [Anaerolineales bacterium]